MKERPIFNTTIGAGDERNRYFSASHDPYIWLHRGFGESRADKRSALWGFEDGKPSPLRISN